MSEAFVVQERTACPVRGQIRRARDQRRVVVIGSATGVTCGYYRSFADALVARGSTVLTFDWPYVGESWPVGVDPADEDARYAAIMQAGHSVTVTGDLVAALDAVLRLADSLRAGRDLVYVGHSQAGLIVPLAPSSRLLSRCMTVSSYYKVFRLDPPGSSVSPGMVEAVGAQAEAELGYFPGKLIGLDDVPLGLNDEWRHWAVRNKWYMADSHLDTLATWQTRTLALSFTDDTSCTIAQLDAPFQFYPHAHVTRLSIDPAARQLPKTGHIAAFHRRHADSGLWSKLMIPFVEDGEVRDELASDRFEKPASRSSKL